MHRSFLPLAVLVSHLVACTPGLEEPAGGHRPAVLERIDGWDGSGESLDVYFVPHGPGLEDRLAEAVLEARSSVRVAMYNLRSARLGYLLLERQRAGVHVEVLWDARQMDKPWNTLDDELIAQGLNIVPIRNERSRYSTLHDKMAVIDGRRVFFGSASWGYGTLHLNDETILEVESPSLAAVIEAEIDEILTGVPAPREGDSESRAQLYFAPGDRLDRVVEDAIDRAEDRVWVAVFSLRLRWLGDALIRAHERGVDVRVITDRGQSSTTSVDDRLRAAGIDVIEAHNDAGDFTAMHHKFAVIDGATVLVGSYNWTYTGTFHNYEDLAVIRDDAEVAAAFEGEIGRLWARYGQTRPNPLPSTAEVVVEAYCDDTGFGDTLVVVGDDPALGAWDPQAGLRLDGTAWPRWNARVELRAGSQLRYKLVILRADGTVRWEHGEDHQATVPTDPEESFSIGGAFRG